MSKWIKTAVFALLLIGAAYFFGVICRQFGQVHRLLLQPSKELLTLLLRFLLALGAVAVTAGLVAVLVRPLWVTILIVASSGLAMLLGWQLQLASGLLVLVYVLGASFYASSVAKDLRECVKFSLQPVSKRQALLLATLAFVACGSLFLDYSTVFQREGFTIPDSLIDSLGTRMQEQLMGMEGEQPPQEALEEFREEFRQRIQTTLDATLAPYQKYIPLLMAVGVFMLLETIMSLVGWIPILILRGIFPLLTLARVTSIVTETKVIEKLVLDREAPEQAS